MPDQALARARRLVAAVVADDITETDPEEDLRDYGLDSIRLMSVAESLREEGTPVDLSALLADPTLAALAQLIDTATPTTTPATEENR